MLEPDCCDRPDLVQTAHPLPWTNGGPKDHSKPQQTASISHPVSVVDSVYQYKNRVINMKQLEALKKRLPPGIDVRISSKNVLTFRARFRRKGYPDLIKTFPDEKLAKQWLAEQERNALLGIYFPQVRGSEHTLSEAIDRYKAEELPRKPKNARNVERHLEWFRCDMGDYALSAIRPSLINEKRIALEKGLTRRGEKRSPTTVRHYLISLSHLFTIAVRDWEWLHENPMEKVTKPKPTPGRQRYLTKDEKIVLLTEAKNSRCPVLYPIIVLALSTGMRRGEILKLKIEDVCINDRTIKLKTSKNKEPRLVSLVGHAHQIIASILETKSNEDPQNLIFASPRSPLKPYDIETAWKATLKRAGIKDYRFHDNRHSHASVLAEMGKSLLEIGDSIGHMTTQSTKRYSHLTQQHKEKMAEEADQKLFGGLLL
jgi:integrase